MMSAQKLTLMKNQILEYDRYVGMNRKYGAVKINALKNLPVTVSILICLFADYNLLMFKCRLNSLKTMRGKRRIKSLLKILVGI